MLLKSKQDAEEFVFWCVTLQCEVLPKGRTIMIRLVEESFKYLVFFPEIDMYN